MDEVFVAFFSAVHCLKEVDCVTFSICPLKIMIPVVGVY